MSLLTYKDARPWAKSIRDEVADGVMPPWHADPKHGKFSNDRSLTAEKKDIARAVGERRGAGRGPEGPAGGADIHRGLAAGRAGRRAAAPGRVQGAGRRLRRVPSTSRSRPTSPKTSGSQALEVRPGESRGGPSRDRVGACAKAGAASGGLPPGRRHGHSRGAIRRPAEAEDGAEARARAEPVPVSARRGAPRSAGSRPARPACGSIPAAAMLIRAGSTMVVQMHYTTNGTAQTDRTTMGLFLAKETPKVEMRMATLVNGKLHIPAGAADYSIAAEMTTVNDVTLRSLLPHTHLRGKRWEYTATYPDGRTEVILSVPKYDFNWQTDYVFAQPLKLPKGTKIRAVAHYDNSAANKSNPDPKVDVKWGDQTWEEMMFTSLVYSIDGVAPGDGHRDSAVGRQQAAAERHWWRDRIIDCARSAASALCVRCHAGSLVAHVRISTKVTWDREIAPIVQARCVDLPSRRRPRADVAGHLRRGASLGQGDQGRSPDPANAEVARRPRLRRFLERPVALPVRDRAGRRLGRWRRAREGQPGFAGGRARATQGGERAGRTNRHGAVQRAGGAAGPAPRAEADPQKGLGTAAHAVAPRRQPKSRSSGSGISNPSSPTRTGCEHP